MLIGLSESTASAPRWLANALAQSGWHVCPWDFDEPTPSFIRLIEGLLFVSMLPLHRDEPRRQLAMLANGLTLLNDVLGGPQ